MHFRQNIKYYPPQKNTGCPKNPRDPCLSASMTMPKSWIEIRVEVPSSLTEAVSNFLIEQGSPGVIQEEAPARGERREWIISYFADERSFPQIKKRLGRYVSSLGQKLPVRYRVIRDEKWAESWKENFKPVHVTPSLVVAPPWEKYVARKGEIVIEIDPGMAFGTGTHPSTQMCLEALEKLILPSSGKLSLLDVGTGSGILAIAAWKMGVKDVLAVDIDPVAIDCARKNAAANGVDRRIDFRVGSLSRLRRRFDIVAANLLPQEILKLTRSLAGRMAPEGLLIVSGILRGQKKEIAAAFAEHGLKVWRSRELKGWACLIFRKESLREKRG